MKKLFMNICNGTAIEINVEINTGEGSFIAYTCDFTKDYIDINADYRS